MVVWKRPGRRLKFRVVGIQNQSGFAGNLLAILDGKTKATEADLEPENKPRLVRQPDNPHDPNAVLVYAGQYPLGYVPRRCCLDCGQPAAAAQTEDKCLNCWEPLIRLADLLAASIDAGHTPPIWLDCVARTKGLFAAFTLEESDVHYPEVFGEIPNGPPTQTPDPEEGG